MKNRIPKQSVIPAVLTPFDDQLKIDFAGFRRHLEDVSAVDGVTAIMVNGASGQDVTLTRDDKTRLLKIAIEASDGRIPIIGAVRESEIESDLAVLARDAEDAGAEAIMVMPPGSPEASTVDGALARFGKVFDGCSLPVAYYQVNPERNGYPTDTMAALAEQARVFAVKEGSGDPVTSEKDMRIVRSANPDIAVWSTHTRWLIADLALGADGVLSGMGSISADLHVALCRAVWDGDLPAAQKVARVLFDLTQVLYAPGQNPHTRMKYALKQLGRMEHDHIRPPQAPLDDAEKARVDGILALLR